MSRLALGLGTVLLGGLLISLIPVVDVAAGGAKVSKGRLPNNWKLLGLSREQTQKIYSIQEKADLMVADLEQQIEKLRQDERKQMYEVLTDTQREALRQILLKRGGAVELPPEKKAAKKE